MFTDLDGSLLDQETYSYENAHGALELIRKRRIPLVFTTSKTRPEIELLQADMRILEPFIVENGAAVFFPDGYGGLRLEAGFRRHPYHVIQLGAAYGEIRTLFCSLKTRFKIKGFGDLNAEEIERLTGLPRKQVGLAMQREFTEPFIIADESNLSDLQQMAETRGFKIVRGGRFYHLIGANQDKGRAVDMAVSVFRSHADKKLTTIGLGDSANDIPMLERVDIPILIPHPDGTHEDIDLPNLRKASYPGSRGWNEMMLEVLGHIQAKA
ncbi:MAG: HAD-IIB family hydrolase [Hyphomicrobiales bacterium]